MKNNFDNEIDSVPEATLKEGLPALQNNIYIYMLPTFCTCFRKSTDALGPVRFGRGDYITLTAVLMLQDYGGIFPCGWTCTAAVLVQRLSFLREWMPTNDSVAGLLSGSIRLQWLPPGRFLTAYSYLRRQTIAQVSRKVIRARVFGKKTISLSSDIWIFPTATEDLV